MSWYLIVLKNYFNFSGRAHRQEYWMFVLFNAVFGIVLSGVDKLAGTGGIIFVLYFLAMLIPSISVQVRRLHDIGKSGWYILVALIPLAGPIWLLILLVTASQQNDNQYGQVPA